MINVIRHAVAWFQIPKGLYCYKPTEWKPFLGKLLQHQSAKYYVCPYWKEAGFVSRCEHLNITDDTLLNDQCKICGIKENE